MRLGKKGALGRRFRQRTAHKSKLGLLELKVVLKGVLEATLKGPDLGPICLALNGYTNRQESKALKPTVRRKDARMLKIKLVMPLSGSLRPLPFAFERQTMQKRP